MAEPNIHYIIYKNLLELINTRGLKSEHEILTESAFNNHLNIYEHVTIRGSRDDNDTRGASNTLIILFMSGSKYVARTAELKKILRDINEQVTDLLMIASSEPGMNVREELARFKEQRPKLNMRVEVYDKFLINPTRHLYAAEHVVISNKEVQQLLQSQYCTLADLQIIRSDDAIVLWTGGRPGHVYRITRLSNNSGRSITYRVCI